MMPSPVDSPLNSLRTVIRATNGYEVACDALGILAIVATVGLTNRTAGLVLAWAALGLVAAPPVAKMLGLLTEQGNTKTHNLGFGQSARTLALLSAFSIRSAAGESAWEALVSLVLAVLMLLEVAMRRPLRNIAPPAANIPGWEVPLPSLSIGNWLFGADTVATGVALLAAGLGQPLWGLIVVLVPGVVLATMLSMQVVRYLIGRRRFEANLPKILKKMAPAFAFHWQAPGGTAYQAAMWLPYLERLGTPFFVLVRTQVNFNEVAAMTSAPVILRAGLSDLDAVICPSLRAVFYCNTAVRNSHMIRFTQLTHIQLNHGDSDKIASVSPTFRQYDKNFVAGEAAIDRFAKHGVATLREQFVLVGRPQLEGVMPSRGPISSLRQPTALYCPTWSGFYEDSDYSSLPAGQDIVQGLLDRGCTVVFRAHPYARRHRVNALACDLINTLLESDAKATGRDHKWGAAAENEMSIVDCYNASDVMVSDVSSVVSDYLFSGKPFAMAAVSRHGDDFAAEFPMAEAAYVFDVVDGQAVGLDTALDNLLGEDPLGPHRASLRTYYLGDATAETAAERFIQAARAYIA